MLKILFTLLVIPVASAVAVPNFNTLKDFRMMNLKSTQAQNEQDYDFSGIIGLSNCSAALVKFKNDNDLSKKALVMTNGHCLGMGSGSIYGSKMPAYGEVLVDKEVKRAVHLFAKESSPIASFSTTKLVYGTMTDTDFALYEVEKTYKQIKDQYGIDALVLADSKPQTGEPIEIISGYWKKGYSCRMDYEVFSMKEGEWIWKNSIKYTQPGCETIGGTSGSPIISSLTREIVGINNTGNDDSGAACSVMNPCEIDEFGNVKDDNHASYGQQTYLVYSCLNDKFEIDLSIKDCKLPK